jgi:hypothetical protein
MGAVAWGLRPTLRFPSPLIEPEVPISGIRLSDWFHRKVNRNLVFDPEAAEPAVGNVHLNLAAQRTFRADREHIADEPPTSSERRTTVRSVSHGKEIHPGGKINFCKAWFKMNASRHPCAAALQRPSGQA